MTTSTQITVIRTIERPALCTKIAHKAINERLAKDRWLYNHFLETINKHYDDTKETLSFFDCCAKLKTLRKTDEVLARYNVTSQRYVLKRLCNAFVRFYKKEGGKPRFKGLNRKIRSLETDSFRILPNNKIKIKGLPGIKVRNIPEGKIKLVRILKTALRVTVQFVVEQVKEIVLSNAPIVGIDLGINSLAVLSDGTEYVGRVRDHSEIKALQKDLHLQRRKGKTGKHNKPKTKGSDVHRAVRFKLAKTHERVRIREWNALHRISCEIVNTHPNIAIEDLRIPNMVKNKKLSRSILEQGWGYLKSMLTYKSKETGGEVIQVSAHNTSKTCSGCGSVKEELSLSERVYTCSECGIAINRDLNAAINISRRALARPSGGDLVDGFGSVVSDRGSDLDGASSSVWGNAFRTDKDIMAGSHLYNRQIK